MGRVLAALKAPFGSNETQPPADGDKITHIDFRGHNRHALGELYDLNRTPNGFNEEWSLKHWREVAERFDKMTGLARMIDDAIGNELLDYATRQECGECGGRFRLKRHGTTLVAENECVHAGGIKAYDVLLAIPSGKIVFANDLRSLTLIDDHFDVNHTIGQVRTTKAYAEDGMAHVFVGNTCPGVYRTDEGFAVQLHNGRYDEDGDYLDPGEDDEAEDAPERLGSICTDLWWYSAMDQDLFLARCAETGEDPDDFDHFVVEVEPGVYAFSDELADLDASGTVNLSRIRKVEAEAPALKSRATGLAASLEDSQFWREVNRLVGFCRSRDAALGDICTVLGNGYNWHKGSLRNINGHADDTPFRAPLTPVEEPRPTDFIPALPGFKPGFRMSGQFYPLCWNYPKLGAAPLNADPYWLAGGMMFLKSAIASDYQILGWDRNTPEQNQAQKDTHHAVMIASLDVLCEIAEQRGLVADGTLPRLFAEIAEAWA